MSLRTTPFRTLSAALRSRVVVSAIAALGVLFARSVPTAVQSGVGEPQRTVVALMPNGDVVAEVEKPEGRVTRAPGLSTTDLRDSHFSAGNERTPRRGGL